LELILISGYHAHKIVDIGVVFILGNFHSIRFRSL